VRDAFGNEAPTTAAPIKRRPGRPSRVSRHDDDAPRNRRGEIVSRVGVREGFFNEFDVPESEKWSAVEDAIEELGQQIIGGLIQ